MRHGSVDLDQIETGTASVSRIDSARALWLSAVLSEDGQPYSLRRGSAVWTGDRLAFGVAPASFSDGCVGDDDCYLDTHWEYRDDGATIAPEWVPQTDETGQM